MHRGSGWRGSGAGLAGVEERHALLLHAYLPVLDFEVHSVSNFGDPCFGFWRFWNPGSGFSGLGSGLRVWGWEFSVQGLWLRF